IPGLVMPWMPVFVMSDTETVCVPTVLSVTLNCFVPFTSVPLSGVLPAASLDVMRTWSALGTGFHHASVDHTVAVNARPAPCEAGVPDTPLGLPGSGDCPGTTTCTRENGAGCTTNGSLVPFLPGALCSQA